MFKKGTLSRWLAGAFVIVALAIGCWARIDGINSAATGVNYVRDTGEVGAGILTGSLSGGGDKFAAAKTAASKPTKGIAP